MISIENAYLYFRPDYGYESEPIAGRLIRSDLWHDEAYFIPLHVENTRDIDLGYEVSGDEGRSSYGRIWFRHKVVAEEVKKAWLLEFECEYKTNKQEAEYFKDLILKNGGTIEEESAE